MNHYEQKQSNRKERLLELADRMQSASDAAYTRAHKMAEIIPMGQPIMVGHYSEKSDRAYRAKIWRTQDRCLELQRKAEYFRSKALSVGNGGISADDPEAVVKLKEKLVNLEQLQASMKAVNTAHKKFLKDPASLDNSCLPDSLKTRIRNYKPNYTWEPHPFAPFEMSNNNANIKRVRDRINALSANATVESSERSQGEITIREDTEQNRIMLLFPSKPSDDIRALLKSNGFRWSPTNGAWQRQLNNGARYAAECVLKNIPTAGVSA